MTKLELVADREQAVKFRGVPDAAAALKTIAEAPLAANLMGLMQVRETHLVSEDGGVMLRFFMTDNSRWYLGNAETVAARRLSEAKRQVVTWQSLLISDGELARPEDSPFWEKYVAAKEDYAAEVAEAAK